LPCTLAAVLLQGSHTFCWCARKSWFSGPEWEGTNDSVCGRSMGGERCAHATRTGGGCRREFRDNRDCLVLYGCAETEPDQSSCTASLCGKTRCTWNGGSKLSLLRLQTTLYHSSFYASHTFGLGLRPTNQTTQYDGIVTSHCSTLILIGQTIKLLGKSKTQENWGLFAHQPPLACNTQQYAAQITPNTEHKYALSKPF
jgi:hypothetical protein